ncbi:hypothetical protein [Streptomyces sp. NPDC001340]
MTCTVARNRNLSRFRVRRQFPSYDSDEDGHDDAAGWHVRQVEDDHVGVEVHAEAGRPVEHAGEVAGRILLAPFQADRANAAGDVSESVTVTGCTRRIHDPQDIDPIAGLTIGGHWRPKASEKIMRIGLTIVDGRRYPPASG